MRAFIVFGLIYSVFSQQVQYGLNGNCGNNYPECETYFDGCNECTCEVGDSSSIACTELACLVNETPFCEECEEDSYWLAFNTFQPPGTVSCSSRFLRSAIFLSNNSKCACPASNPYYERGVGCINADGCDRILQGKKARGKDKFRFTTPPQNRKCPYEYQLCTSDSDCGYGLGCYIPEDNYKECIPLSAKFDKDCNLVTGCKKCIDDCMGTGYGYCVDQDDLEVQCERGGCSNQGCFPVDEPGFTTCDFRCEYSCLDFQTCQDDGTGTCAFITNEGEEDDYQNCLDDCACNSKFSILPCPFSSTDSEPICETGGCRGELCGPEGTGDLATICIAPTCEESCLEYATCEADDEGTCGWQATDETSTDYQDCLDACNFPDISSTESEVECERGGCSNQGCFPVDEPGITVCDLRCEYSCLDFQTCKDDGTGQCAFITNEGEEDDYQNCLDECACGDGLSALPCPFSSTDSEPICETGGCRSELCGPEGTGDLATICIAPTCEESCLQYATCEADDEGTCGWQATDETSTDYQDCLDACNFPDISSTESEVKCERGGCSNQGCFPVDEPGITVCDIRCEYTCLQFQTCKDDGTGTCAFITNEGEEDDYQNCLDECACGDGLTALPCPFTSTDADPCPVDRPNSNDSCDFEGTCYYGEETCCGETFPSYGCVCINGATGCFFTDACLFPQCDRSTTVSP